MGALKVVDKHINDQRRVIYDEDDYSGVPDPVNGPVGCAVIVTILGILLVSGAAMVAAILGLIQLGGWLVRMFS